MSGHVFVVGADLRRLVCDDVLVPTDRSLRVTPEWRWLLPDVLVGSEDRNGVCLDLGWDGDERVLEVPDRRAGEPGRQLWLVDTVDDRERDPEDALRWLVEGAREALAAVARREVPTPVHGRARRLVALPALGTGWGVAGHRADRAGFRPGGTR